MNPHLNTHVRGHAEGWSVYKAGNGAWRWSAYAARGGSIGVADSEAQATGLARRALENLRRLSGAAA